MSDDDLCRVSDDLRKFEDEYDRVEHRWAAAEAFAEQIVRDGYADTDELMEALDFHAFELRPTATAAWNEILEAAQSGRLPAVRKALVEYLTRQKLEDR